MQITYRHYALLVAGVFLLLPACLRRDAHGRTILKARETFSEYAALYHHELKILARNEYDMIKKELKDIIRIKNEEWAHRNAGSWWSRLFATPDPYDYYPFLQYRRQLNARLNELYRHHRRISRLGIPLGYQLKNLIDKLETLRKLTVTFDEYQQERHAFVRQERHQREHNQVTHLLSEQNRMLAQQTESVKNQT